MHSNEDVMRTTNTATDLWYKQGNVYDFTKPGYSYETKYFTQLVWKTTTEVGCGISGKFVVCHYCNKRGNSGNLKEFE